LAVELGRISIRRFIFSLILLIVALLLTLSLSLSVGSSEIGPIDALRFLIGFSRDETVARVMGVRIWRTAAAALSGALLALSGLLMQTVTRNPLADPYIFGLSSTALTAVAAAILINPAVQADSGALLVVSFFGALAGFALTLALSSLAGGSPIAMVLAGVAVSSVFSGVSRILLYMLQRVLDRPYYLLLMGSAYHVLARHIPYLAASLLFGFAASMLLFKPLNLYIYGDTYTREVGFSPRLVAVSASALASLMTGSTIAVVGIVGFIGLAAPHIARLMVGADHRFSIPATVLIGAEIALIADICTRFISRLGFGELPLGVVTSVIGAPFLAYIVIRKVRQQ